MQAFIIESESVNPFENLALEEHLLYEKPNDYLLYLWQNQNTVVIGRNQNCYTECNLDAMHDDNVTLARRLSGGGAVFHDLGNLNFTFIAPKRIFDIQKHFEIIMRAIKTFDISAKFSGRNDILVDNKKISGNAYYNGTVCSYHHGTLLINTDMNKLIRYLNVSTDKLSSKGIRSVKSRVTNLQTHNKHITIETMKQSLIDSFETVFNVQTQRLNNKFEISALKDKYAAKSWNYGQKINGEIHLYKRFAWGRIDFVFNLDNDKHISHCEIYSDAMETELVDELRKCFIGKLYSIESLCSALDKLNFPVQIHDIKQFIGGAI